MNKLNISIKEEGVNRKANTKTTIEPDMAKNYNSSRSNVSQKFTHDPGVTMILTDICRTKIDWDRNNLQIELQLDKSIKVLKGKLEN